MEIPRQEIISNQISTVYVTPKGFIQLLKEQKPKEVTILKKTRYNLLGGFEEVYQHAEFEIKVNDRKRYGDITRITIRTRDFSSPSKEIAFIISTLKQLGYKAKNQYISKNMYGRDKIITYERG